ncbi:MAG TPA: hypothetical protein H9830_01865 [Candidatus Agrococcus pullicola]|uniref:Uncharacterized protein n=1 Tax=Candidatus Agrococcus pullicola TaxID=2838429 RepID=A0A9D1YTE7_9MICO|nr:hypothetical protein [Candidatus Agrococcus pullicola]
MLLWFAEDDDRLSDATLRRPLLALEEALTGTRWALAPGPGDPAAQGPAVVSLLRSIALLTGRNPALRAHTIADVLAGAEDIAPLHVDDLPSRSTVVGLGTRSSPRAAMR